MSANTDALIRQITDTIVSTANPMSIYLFGSYARGQTHRDSDLDLLVVIDGTFGPKRSRLSEINKIRSQLTQFRVPKDILVYKADELKAWRNSPGHVIGRCIKEGKLLYDRP